MSQNAAANRFNATWIPPIVAYCTASIGMTLVNKFVLSGFQFKIPFLMLAIQAMSSVLLLELFTVLGMTKHRPLSRSDAKRWFPVASLMGVMLYTGSKSLQYLSVPVFTIFKNLSIILVAYGETRVFGGRVTQLMMASFMLMVLSSVIAAQADLRSTTKTVAQRADAVAGYVWMLFNCVSSACFVIFMRLTIRKNVPGVAPFRDFDTVLYNNLLTAPIFLLLSLGGADGQLSDFVEYYSRPENAVEQSSLLWSLFFSGISAFWISYASAWCMRVTNSTTYSMVGSLNKLPIAISSLLVFKDTEISAGSVGSILLGFLSGILYTVAKLRYDEEQRLGTTLPTKSPTSSTTHFSRESKVLWKVDKS